MKTLVLLLVSVLALTGCATTDYEQYAISLESVAASNAASEVARYQALGKLADGNDPASKAIAALALGGFSSSQKTPLQVTPPRNGWDTFVAVSQVWASPLVNAYGIGKNAAVAVTQSNNAASVAISTNGTFSSIAGLIQAAPTITTINDRHDVVTPAPVVITPTPLVPVVVNQPVVVTPVVQVTPVFVP